MRTAQDGPRAALRLLLPLLLALAGALPASAQSARILLVGDSWAAQAWQARAFQTALQNKGLGQWEEKGDVTAIGGTTAADWATQPFLDLISQELVANPELDIVHLSVGGNDFLQAPPGTDLLMLVAQVRADVRTILAHILSIRPGTRVAFSIYDYVPAGYNTELALFGGVMIAEANAHPNLYFLNNLGVLHHAFGYPGEFGPGETPLPGGHPDYVPLQGGDPAFPGSPDAFDDSIHPTDASYVRLAEHAVDEFYAAWLAQQEVPALRGAPAALLAALLSALAVPALRRSRPR